MAKRDDFETVRIRPFKEDDLDSIGAINRRAWTGGISTHDLLEQRHGLVNGKPWIEQMVQAVATHLAEPDVTTFVAEQESKLVGYAAAQIKNDCEECDLGIVSYNAVDPDYRGRGIGTTLVQQVIDFLKSQGARVLVVWTLEGGEPANKLYQGLGFTELTRFVYYSMEC